MTEPLDLDAIEKQALANVGGPADTDAMRALIRAVRERDAEIERWRADYADTAACLKNERQRAGELIRERDAEIERRRLLANADHEKIASLAARLRDLRAPPGADAIERSSRVWYTEIDGEPQSPGWTIINYARALQQYGDERAREATEAERRRCATIDHIDIEEAATIADHFVCGSCGMDGKAGKAIRARAAKPGS